MTDHIKSIILVGLQFLFILLLLTTTCWHNLLAVSLGLMGLSVVLMLWAAWTMNKSKLRIFPQPAQHATLVVSGPYRFIRHPMYTAVLLWSAALLFGHFTYLRLLFACLLLVILLVKLTWEEQMLSQKFEAYKVYMSKTTRLLPWVFTCCFAVDCMNSAFA